MNWQAAEINPRERIIVALDRPDARRRRSRSCASSRRTPGFSRSGSSSTPPPARRSCARCATSAERIFLDLKLHDIPNTVGRAVESASSLGVEMLTIHLSGGRAMIEAAVLAAPPEMLLLGVTVLTSVDRADVARDRRRFPDGENKSCVLPNSGVDSGIGGVVASPLEIAPLRPSHGSKLKIVTPGIRPRSAATNDQKRALTPAEALSAGADFLVIGRPITAAPDPRAALEQIVADAV